MSQTGQIGLHFNVQSNQEKIKLFSLGHMDDTRDKDQENTL